MGAAVRGIRLMGVIPLRRWVAPAIKTDARRWCLSRARRSALGSKARSKPAYGLTKLLPHGGDLVVCVRDTSVSVPVRADAGRHQRSCARSRSRTFSDGDDLILILIDHNP